MSMKLKKPIAKKKALNIYEVSAIEAKMEFKNGRKKKNSSKQRKQK